jgi:hypothetical protein
MAPADPRPSTASVEGSLGRESAALTRTDRLLGAVLVLATLVINATQMGVATALLGVAMVGAYAMWVSGRWKRADSTTVAVYVAGIVLQVAHFAEEYLTGFQRDFPALFGYAWSDRRFASFNVAWLVVFSIAAIGLLRSVRIAYLVVLFFAIMGGIGNGLGHLALSASRGGYFPGAMTAVGSLIVGVVLLVRMNRLRERASIAAVLQS